MYSSDYLAVIIPTLKSFFFFFLIYFYFIYLWLCWVFVSVRGLSLVVAKQGPLFIAVRGPLIIAASRCGAQAPDAQAQ